MPTKTKKIAPIKFTPLGKLWEKIRKNKKDEKKLEEFGRLFLKSKFWTVLAENEKKNFDEYSKRGIKKETPIYVAIFMDNSVPLFEDWEELGKIVKKKLKKYKANEFEFMRQTGKEMIQYMRSRNTDYSIKLAGIKDMIILSAGDASWIKKNLIKK